MKVVWSDLAELDSYTQAMWLLVRAGENVSQNFLCAVDTTMSALSRWPRTGSRCEWVTDAEVRRIRVTGFPQHLVIYSVVNNIVRVERVLHGAQNLEYVFEGDIRND